VSTLALWLGVGVIGGAASVARHVAQRAFAAGPRAGLPLGTLAVNVSGSFLLGLLVGAGVGGDGYLLAGTAAIGAYTTFSAWMLDTRRVAGSSGLRRAAANILLGIALGLLAAELGRTLAGG
jgi:CrcB protein